MPKTYYIPDVYSGCIAWYNFRKGRQAEKKVNKKDYFCNYFPFISILQLGNFMLKFQSFQTAQNDTQTQCWLSKHLSKQNRFFLGNVYDYILWKSWFYSGLLFVRLVLNRGGDFKGFWWEKLEGTLCSFEVSFFFLSHFIWRKAKWMREERKWTKPKQNPKQNKKHFWNLTKYLFYSYITNLVSTSHFLLQLTIFFLYWKRTNFRNIKHMEHHKFKMEHHKFMLMTFHKTGAM